MTIVQDPNETTHGVAFKVCGIGLIIEALEHLYYREVESGYSFEMVTIESEDGTELKSLSVIATARNCFYLGPTADAQQMAWEIAHAAGFGGQNREYLFKLADAMRDLFPTVHDPHLFELESSVSEILNIETKKLSLDLQSFENAEEKRISSSQIDEMITEIQNAQKTVVVLA